MLKIQSKFIEMIAEKNKIIIEAVFKLRAWCIENLPIDNSLIAYDLLLLLSIHHYSNGEITVKQLFASMPYSYTATRVHYQRYVTDGWIEHYSDEKDRRIKYVRPTKKFIETINLFALTAGKLFIIESPDAGQ